MRRDIDWAWNTCALDCAHALEILRAHLDNAYKLPRDPRRDLDIYALDEAYMTVLRRLLEYRKLVAMECAAWFDASAFSPAPLYHPLASDLSEVQEA